jgi:RNA polymerase sigma factor (sigma-70 family)
MANDPQPNASRTGNHWFTTTHWSVVLAAGHSSVPDAREALERLCRTYWYPLYGFVRRQGHGSHDAQDLTQGFFAALLENRGLSVADPERGRFRSFLLARLKNFLSDERKKKNAQKRGGGQPVLSLDADVAEERYRSEPVEEMTPELIFDQRWAVAVMEQSVGKLRSEYGRADRAELFEHLKDFQLGQEDSRSYTEVARRLSLSEAAVKSAIFRLRQRHRELLRQEIAETVATPADIDEEIRYLVSMLGG